MKSTQCNRCVSAGGGDCATCKPEVEKPQSVRSQRKFEESMATWLQNIDNSVYAAENLCGVNPGSICKHKERECAFKSKMFPTSSLYICKLRSLRILIGDHTPQHDIESVELSE